MLKKSLFLLLLSFCSYLVLPAQSITFMTYNIRMDNAGDSLNAWPHRKKFLLNQVRFYSPDVMGTQEGFKHQLDFLDNGLENYEYKGIARDDGRTKGEYTAVFYNKQKFNLLKEGTFWLSERPDTVGLGWDAVCNRTCTYLLLENKKTQEKCWVFNTHFDHRGKIARAKSAQLIIKKAQLLNAEKYPIIVMGDFNVVPSDPVYSILTETLVDTKVVSQQPAFGNEGTFNGFRFHEPLKRRIDYIFVNKAEVTVLKYAALSDSKNCRYPSDHLPVLAEVAFKAKK